MHPLRMKRDVSSLQRLFSTFPDGRPGIGLLCLRLGVSIPLIHYGIGSLPPSPLDLVAAFAGIFLLAGLWTPLAGAAVAMTELWIVFSQSADPWTHFLLAVLGASLALLGPGAWSVDARLFGRKIFVNRDGD